MSNEVEVTVAPTRFTVSVLPETDRNHSAYTVEVEYRGLSRWAGWYVLTYTL